MKFQKYGQFLKFHYDVVLIQINADLYLYIDFYLYFEKRIRLAAIVKLLLEGQLDFHFFVIRRVN